MRATEFAGCFAKLDWADTQITILETDLRQFMSRKPYVVREKSKPKMTEEPNAAQANLFAKGRFHEIVMTEHIPPLITTAAGMIIQAQRDSLDHLAWALAKRNGANDDTATAFVITETEELFHGKSIQRRLRYLTEADRAKIKALQPHNGQNDMLLALNRLSNQSKHREMVPIAPRENDFRVGGNGHVRRFLYLPAGNRLCPDEAIIVLDADENVHLDVTATIAFRDIFYAKGPSVVEGLHQLSNLCRNIIDLWR